MKVLLAVALAGLVACAGCSADKQPQQPSPAAATTVAASPTGSPSDAARTVAVFFESGGCTGSARVERQVASSQPEATAALDALLAGPTAAEREQGLSFFGDPSRRLLRSVRVGAGTAYVDLEEAFASLNNVSTSCNSQIFLGGVENTLRPFGAREVRYAIGGDPRSFYELMQIGCPPQAAPGDRCDPAPFSR